MFWKGSNFAEVVDFFFLFLVLSKAFHFTFTVVRRTISHHVFNMKQVELRIKCELFRNHLITPKIKIQVNVTFGFLLHFMDVSSTLHVIYLWSNHTFSNGSMKWSNKFRMQKKNNVSFEWETTSNTFTTTMCTESAKLCRSSPKTCLHLNFKWHVF